MEKKTKYRIIGALAVMALVILAMPLLRNEKSLSTPTTVVQAPPFPDQASIAPSAVEQSVAEENPPVIAAPEATYDQGKDAAVPAQIESPKKTLTQNNDDKKITEINKPAEVDAPSSRTKINKLKLSKDFSKPLTKLTLKKKPPISDKNLDKNGLFNLKTPAWVIQLGSFKDKNNALQLVNQLRANGYNAFIQEISTAFGQSTRVFVGPENKQVNARAIAERLQAEMDMHGIIISYKPLSL